MSVSAPHIETVDPAGILAAALHRRVDLRLGDAPIQLSVAVVEARLHLDAEIVTRAWERVLGRDPVGSLLSWRIAAGDRWAVQVVDQVDTVLTTVQRRLGRPPTAPGGPTVLHDATVGDTTVTYDETAGGRVIRLHAEVPADEAGPRHLRAMAVLALELVPESSLGDRYVLHAVPVPRQPRTTGNVTLDQVGGLPGVVAEMREIALSFRHPQAMARWGARRPQGILMYGPPGTGKTMLARALANEINADFVEIRTPEILDKWLGGSERNIKRIFRDARNYRRPTVMLFDEFDSIISYTGSGGDAASQAINAVAGIFKQEMNNLIEENPNVIVVATTNVPQRVDESLIRSGRFDIKISVPVPDRQGRADIIGKMIAELAEGHDEPGFKMFADDVDATELAGVSAGMTGADIREALRRVQLAKAMQEARTGVPSPPITQADLHAGVADVLRGTH